MAEPETDLGPIASMLQHMEDAVIVTTADLEAPGPTIVFVNRSFSELTGYASGEIIGKTPRILQGSVKRSENYSIIRENLQTKNHFYGEVFNRRKDGSEYAARCQIIPYFNGYGDVLYWINIQRDFTPLKNERHGREIAEKTYRDLVENQPDLICQFLPDTTLAFVNDSYARFLGRDLRELTESRFIEFLADDDRRQIMSHLESLTSEEPSKQYEHRFTGEEGRPRWHLWRYTAFFDAAGRLLSYQAVGTDITERKQAEAALEESNRHLEAILNNIPDIAWLKDTESRFIAVNEPFVTACGVPPTDLVGKTDLDIWPSELAHSYRADDRDVLRSGKRKIVEERLVDHVSNETWIETIKTPILNERKEAIGTTGIARDITQRRQMESALRDSERRFRDFAASASDWFWEMGPDLRFTWFSDNLHSATGISADRLIGKRRQDIVKPDVDDRLWSAHLDNLVKQRAFKGFQYRTLSDDGHPLHVSISGVPVFGDDGKFHGYRGTGTNISSQVLAQKEAAKAKERLEDAIESIADGFALYDSDDRLVLYNENYRQALPEISKFLVPGARFEHLLKKLVECGHMRIPEGKTEAWVRKQLAEHGKLGALHEYQMRDGRWTEVREYQTRDGGTVVIRTDITHRKRAEAALFDAKERAQVTLHSVGDAVITTDASGIVEYLNPVAEALTGWQADAAKGLALEKVFRIIDEDTREPVPDPITRCLREGKIAGLANHSVLIDLSGQEHAIEVTAAPIRGTNSELLGAVLVFHDVSETRRMARQLAHDAAHDPLTGLINRREFEKRLQHAVLSAKQHGSRHVLCYLDLDQFKLINDTASHAAGDELLKRVRGLLAGKFRERDTLGRLGGDEFGLLLGNCDPEEAQAICDLIVAAFHNYRFSWEGRTFQIGVSIGLVPFTADAESADQLLSQADVACYTAKELGRNQIHLYQKEGAKLSLRHSEIMLASGLQDALGENRFRLYCQPIVELSAANGHPTHYEILLRLLDKGEVLSPSAFIPAAERYGLMNAIDRWVIRKAFQRYKKVFGASSGVEIAINLSGNSLSDDSFFEFLEEQYSRFSIPPQYVCFEITETAAIKSLSKTADLLKKIKSIGSKVAIDDFGTGLSSFTYLKTLPADYLKIDGSFVCSMAENSVDKAMVEAINKVGHTLGMTTIAEWAQSDAVVELLRELGVNWAQGNALWIPVPLDEVAGRATVY